MLYHVSGYVGCAGVLGSIRGKVQKLLRGRESALDTRATRRPPVHTERGGRGLLTVNVPLGWTIFFNIRFSQKGVT